MTDTTKTWQEEFGREYTDRNHLSPAELDALYAKRYGLTRTQMNAEFLAGLPKDAAILEIGCNVGNQLACLQEAGFTDLTGIELQSYAAELGRKRLPAARIDVGSAYELPYEDDSFDLVFTSGVLIHLPLEGLEQAIDEIHRVTRRFVYGLEYHAEQRQDIPYRNLDHHMWRDDFAARYLERHPDLGLVRQDLYPYLDDERLVDAAFLLELRRSDDAA